MNLSRGCPELRAYWSLNSDAESREHTWHGCVHIRTVLIPPMVSEPRN
jgi:hypothetical protein